MRCNLGKSDRIFRVIIGFIVIEAGVYFEAWWGIVGIVPILISAMVWCPFYVPFRISTFRVKV